MVEDQSGSISTYCQVNSIQLTVQVVTQQPTHCINVYLLQDHFIGGYHGTSSSNNSLHERVIKSLLSTQSRPVVNWPMFLRSLLLNPQGRCYRPDALSVAQQCSTVTVAESPGEMLQARCPFCHPTVFYGHCC